MKKNLIIIAAILILISGAYAMEFMEIMEDEELGEVNAQAGMTITAYQSSLRMAFSLEGLSWGDDDGCTTLGLSGGSPGHFALRGATAAGVQSYTTFVEEIPSTGSIKYDVDAAGIYLGLPSFNISIVTPPRIQISVSATPVSAFAGAISADTNRVLGDLALDNMQFTVTMPGVIRWSPH